MAHAQYSFDLEDPFSNDEPSPPPRSPGLLFLFGERGHRDLLVIFADAEIELPSSNAWKDRSLTPSEQAEVNRLKQLFPEADVRAFAEEIPGPPVQQR